MNRNKIIALLCCLLLLHGTLPARAQWHSFRGNEWNVAVTSAQTPTIQTGATLKWAQKLGETWAQVTGFPLLVGESLYVTAGETLYRLDAQTGDVLASGQMSGFAGQGDTPPAYANDTVFVPLDGGILEAFDADSLHSVWRYQDELQGQALSPAVCFDGRVATGFWNGETRQASYVCLDAASGNALWSIPHQGGFYWAGGLSLGDMLLVGSDNGSVKAADPSTLYAIDSASGSIVDTLSVVGDLRSSLCYENETGLVWFTTKGGFLYAVFVTENGTFDHASLTAIDLGGQSTSTPVLFGGYAYVGVCGTSYFGAEGHCIAVVDTASGRVVHRIPTNGYPQCSLLLSTSEFEQTQTVHLYATGNHPLDGVIAIEHQIGGAQPVSGTLFLPDDEAMRAVSVSSLICATDGTLFYKNDSGFLMAIERDANAPTPPPKHTAGSYYDDDGVTVRFSLFGHPDEQQPWIAQQDVVLPHGATAYDLLQTMLAQAGLKMKETPNGDLEAIEIPAWLGGGFQYSAQDGAASGWSYSINGVSAEKGMKEYVLAQGDVVTFHYANMASKPQTPLPQEGPSKPSSLRLPPSHPNKTLSFSDVPTTHWAHQAVGLLAGNGLMQGVGSGHFAPDAFTTRAQLVAILARLSGDKMTEIATTFDDVDKNAWYAAYVAWAVQNGVAKGDGNSAFLPEQPVHRQDFAVMLLRFLDSVQIHLEGEVKRELKDRDQIDDYAASAVERLVQAGVLSGKPDGCFDPRGYTTRAQCAQALANLFALYES